MERNRNPKTTCQQSHLYPLRFGWRLFDAEAAPPRRA